MITRFEDRQSGRTEHFKDGKGYALSRVILPADALGGKGRVYSHVRLEKGCEIGWHIHSGDREAYYILSGEGEYSDNGKVSTVRAGDVCLCEDGEGHSLINLSEEPLDCIALILYS